jgi:cell surface protein SprA
MGLTRSPFALYYQLDISNASTFPGVAKLLSAPLYHKYAYIRIHLSLFLNWGLHINGIWLGARIVCTSATSTYISTVCLSKVSSLSKFAVCLQQYVMKIRYNRTRTLNLNIPSYQIVETSDNDVVLGFGYRIPDFNRLLGIGLSTQKNDNRRRSTSQNVQNNQSMIEIDNSRSSFNNDLNIRFDLSNKITRALICTIEGGLTQATGGLRTVTLQFSADYSQSHITLKLFSTKTIFRHLFRRLHILLRQPARESA